MKRFRRCSARRFILSLLAVCVVIPIFVLSQRLILLTSEGFLLYKFIYTLYVYVYVYVLYCIEDDCVYLCMQDRDRILKICLLLYDPTFLSFPYLCIHNYFCPLFYELGLKVCTFEY